MVALFLAPSAHAQDFDALRGSESVGPASFTRWSGVYFGGQAAYGQGWADFKNAQQGTLGATIDDAGLADVFVPSAAQSLLGSAGDTGFFYGAFIGFNSQWQDLVIGGEIDYTRVNMTFNAPSTPITGLNGYSSNSITQQESEYLLNSSAAAALHLIDYASFRARAGWILGNNLLPYGFTGLVVGRGSFRESAVVTGLSATTGPTVVQTATGPITYTPAPVVSACGNPSSIPETCQVIGAGGGSGSSLNVMYGFNAGVGLDVALTPNVFLRGEFEYVYFFQTQGIMVDLAMARVGAGFKF
ncbi:MAG TPA: hypothetical protein VEK75_01890 [Xanthobacteraceae bacterium]|nr:hypothetical protein [Xanthobacteraceae bacterium]